MKSIQQSSPFDHIRQIENGREFWSARDLQKLLGYKEWRKFEDAIDRAMASCKIAGQNPEGQFVPSANLLKRGKYATQEQVDYHLTRYAAYLVAMNGDPRKEEIALAQTYFAIKTHQAETVSHHPLLNSLWEKRIQLFQERTKIPLGYWCIFDMIAGYCRGDEFRNVHLLDNALPDGSVGKRWCQYLRERGYDMRRIEKYPHIYPDGRGEQKANIYPVEWLPEFWMWFHGCYLVECYPAYVRAHSIGTNKYIEPPHRKHSPLLADDEEII